MSSHSWKRIILGSIFLILSIFYAILFFQKANFNSMSVFNVAHLKSLSNVLSSPINFNYWNHSGSLVNLFSPWLTILPGLLFVSVNATYGFTVFLGLITFLTMISAYFFMNKFSKDTFESILFSVLYTFSLNRFYLVFHQQRLENYLVLIFLPMAYYGAYQFFETKGWKLLTLSLALILWTSPYMAIAVCCTLVPPIFLMIFSKKSHSWQYWKNFSLNSLKTIGITFLTTVGFIAPLVFIQMQQKLLQNPIKNINYIKWFNDQNLSTSQLYSLIGIAVLSFLLLVVIFVKSRFSYKLLMLEIIPLALAVILNVSIKEFDISRLILNFQSILDLFILIVVSRIIIMVFQEGPGILKMLLITVSIVGMGILVNNQANQIHATKTLSNAPSVNYNKFVVNYHDFAENGQNSFLTDNKKTPVSFYTKDNDYWIQYYNPQSTTLDLPVQKYDGYKILLNNETVRTTISKRKTLQLQTHPGKNIIEIHTRHDWISIISLLLNLFGFMLLGYLSLKNLQWKKKKVPDNS